MKFDHLSIPVTDSSRSRGVELTDPDGYLVRLWDERSMNEKNG